MRLKIDHSTIAAIADAVAANARPAGCETVRAAAAAALQSAFALPDDLPAPQAVEFDAEEAKSLAKAISARARQANGAIAHGRILDGVAVGLGRRDWNTLSAELAQDPVHVLRPAAISWVWSGASEPNGFAESAWLTETSARKLERMLERFGDLSGEVSNVRVDIKPDDRTPESGVDVALELLTQHLYEAGLVDEDKVQQVIDTVDAELGPPEADPAERTDTLIAFQMNPERVGEYDQPHFMPEKIVRLTRAEQAYVQKAMDRLRDLPALDGELWDVCVAEQPRRDTTPIRARHDGLVGAVGLCCGYFVDACESADDARALQEAFGDLVDQQAVADLLRKG